MCLGRQFYPLLTNSALLLKSTGEEFFMDVSNLHLIIIKGFNLYKNQCTKLLLCSILTAKHLLDFLFLKKLLNYNIQK